MLTPESLRERLILSGLCQPKQVRGCSETELKRIEKHFGHPLPNEYREVMSVIGKGAGEFMSDLDMFYPSVTKLTDRMRKLLSDEIKLPDDAFVFADRYGEQFLFFHLGASDDPPIYRWHDGDPKRFRRVFKSVWAFVEEELTSHEMLLKEEED